MTAPATVTCSACQGDGEIVRCVNDGPTGCSHVNDFAYVCRDCKGSGEVALGPGESTPEEVPDGGTAVAVVRPSGASVRRDWPVALVLLVLIFGSLVFLTLLAQGQRAMCHIHHDQLRYCAHYQETTGR